MSLENNIWYEAAMLPFLFILTVFLFVRYATSVEMNRRFRLLSLSTFLATLLGTASRFILLHDAVPHVLFLPVFSLYLGVANLNAYDLLRYICAFVRFENRRFITLCRAILYLSFLLLLVNLFTGTFFAIGADGVMRTGRFYTLLRAGCIFFFVGAAFCLQDAYQHFFTEIQYILMNLLFFLLVSAFVIQYLFFKNILIVYVVVTILIFITFFYLETPAYRRMQKTQEQLLLATREAESAAARAKTANRAKSDFLANTSHEIRTPMNAILGMNDMILRESTDAEVLDAARDIREAGENLLQIINNILDISRIESGKMELYPTSYHLARLLKELLPGERKRAEKKGLTFEFTADETLKEHLYGDAEKVQQIMKQLIDNAIKYTESGGVKVTLDGRETDSRMMLRFRVEDTGTGIRKEDLDRLFETFERLNGEVTANVRGAGLGLALARHLVDLMGGAIRAESEYGKGSIFTVEFEQRLSGEGDPGTIAAYLQKHGGFFETEKDAAQTGGKENETAFTCPDAHLLLVDDTPVNLVVAQKMLKNSCARVETAASGEECLELLTEHRYDIVFLDYQMPGLDGIETLRFAKTMDSNLSADAKYIVLTADAGEGEREKFLEAGFDDYLAKPVKEEAVTGILARYLPEALKV